MLEHAEARTAMRDIATPDLERIKWHGFFYRKRDAADRYMNRIRPVDVMETCQRGLVEHEVPSERIHTEQFNSAPASVAAK